MPGQCSFPLRIHCSWRPDPSVALCPRDRPWPCGEVLYLPLSLRGSWIEAHPCTLCEGVAFFCAFSGGVAPASKCSAGLGSWLVYVVYLVSFGALSQLLPLHCCRRWRTGVAEGGPCSRSQRHTEGKGGCVPRHVPP